MFGRFPYDDALKLTALADPAGFLEALKQVLHLAADAYTLVGVPVSGELQAERRYADLVWRIPRDAQRDEGAEMMDCHAV